jgi:DNA repair exonuclease SbcCD nuclease subunit
MRILHVTDTHLGTEAWYRGSPAGWSRAGDHMATFRAAVGPALREEVDLVVHSGDVFNR